MIAGYVEFEFDLPEALLHNLISILDQVEPVALTADSVAPVPEHQGVYQLLLDGKITYIGKTDAESGLHKRLTRHAKKILYRKNLDPGRVSFKAVRIYVFTAMDLESALIEHYGGVKKISWNGSGFGSNDPGRKRDHTEVDSENYDALFPIDIDRKIAFSIEKGESAADALSRLKNELPFNLRYEVGRARRREAHSDLVGASMHALKGPVSARQALSHVVRALPQGWQATALPGYIILYKENTSYPQGIVIAQS